jgi:predicted DNA-binding transcriptional regulator YafY
MFEIKMEENNICKQNDETEKKIQENTAKFLNLKKQFKNMLTQYKESQSQNIEVPVKKKRNAKVKSYDVRISESFQIFLSIQEINLCEVNKKILYDILIEFVEDATPAAFALQTGQKELKFYLHDKKTKNSGIVF